LHIATHSQARERYPAIYNGDGKGDGQAGYEAWSFAVAQSGIVGGIETVNKLPLWDFLEILNHLILQK